MNETRTRPERDQPRGRMRENWAKLPDQAGLYWGDPWDWNPDASTNRPSRTSVRRGRTGFLRLNKWTLSYRF